MLNPCHGINLIQGYLLISRNDIKQRTIYSAMMNFLFSPWIAIAFPVTRGLDSPFEIPMFWLEHYMAGLINPLVLSICGRYYSKNTISVKNHIFSHSLFGLYQRIILFPLSQMTYANLNFTLCPATADPFLPFVEKWYYIASDIYIYAGGEIFHRLIKMIIKMLLSIKELFNEENVSKKNE